MKHGSEYAKRLKKLFQDMERKYGKPEPTDQSDPIEQLMLGILAECTSRQKAEGALKKIVQQMVDLNELRVTPVNELVQTMGDGFPLAESKALRLVQALNAVRMRQETMDLAPLRQRGVREAREYLESLEGVSPAAAADVVLHSLGGHAIPVDDLALYILRKDEIVEPNADLRTVQNFLERNINASDALVFTELLNKYVMSKASRVPVEKLPELLYPESAQPAEEKPAAAEQKETAPAESKESKEEAASPAVEEEKKAERKKKTKSKASSASARSKSTESPKKKETSGKKKMSSKKSSSGKDDGKTAKPSSGKKTSSKKSAAKKPTSGKKQKSRASKK